MNIEKNYSKANNIKYIINGKSLHRWCYENGYSYNQAIYMKKNGITDKKIETYMKERYINKKDETNIAQFAKKIEKKYWHYNISDRRKIKQRFFTLFANNNQSEQYWNMITLDKDIDVKNNELWMPVKGFKKYEVSNIGRFRSHYETSNIIRIIKATKIIKHPRDRSCRLVKIIKLNGATYTAARLVAETFLQKPDKSYNFINYKDGNPYNIVADNLQWITAEEHGRLYGWKSKAKAVKVNGVNYRSVRQAAEKNNVSYQTIFDIISGKTNKKILDVVLID
jgi:hypothetical protein